MAGGLTDYAEQNLAELIFTGATGDTGGDAYPTTWYVELTSTNPTDNTAGTALSGSGYSGRLAYANSAMTITVSGTPATVTVSNTAILGGDPGWGEATGTWTVEGWELWDASSAGNRWFWCDDPAAVAVPSGVFVEFAPGALSIPIS